MARRKSSGWSNLAIVLWRPCPCWRTLCDSPTIVYDNNSSGAIIFAWSLCYSLVCSRLLILLLISRSSSNSASFLPPYLVYVVFISLPLINVCSKSDFSILIITVKTLGLWHENRKVLLSSLKRNVKWIWTTTQYGNGREQRHHSCRWSSCKNFDNGSYLLVFVFNGFWVIFVKFRYWKIFNAIEPPSQMPIMYVPFKK